MEAKAKAMADRMAKLSGGSPTAVTAAVRAEEGLPPDPEPEAEAEPEKPLSPFEARQVLSQVEELDAKLEKAIADEDFGLCAGLHAELELLAAKKAEAQGLLKEATTAWPAGGGEV